MNKEVKIMPMDYDLPNEDVLKRVNDFDKQINNNLGIPRKHLSKNNYLVPTTGFVPAGNSPFLSLSNSPDICTTPLSDRNMEKSCKRIIALWMEHCSNEMDGINRFKMLDDCYYGQVSDDIQSHQNYIKELSGGML